MRIKHWRSQWHSRERSRSFSLDVAGNSRHTTPGSGQCRALDQDARGIEARHRPATVMWIPHVEPFSDAACGMLVCIDDTRRGTPFCRRAAPLAAERQLSRLFSDAVGRSPVRRLPLGVAPHDRIERNSSAFEFVVLDSPELAVRPRAGVSEQFAAVDGAADVIRSPIGAATPRWSWPGAPSHRTTRIRTGGLRARRAAAGRSNMPYGKRSGSWSKSNSARAALVEHRRCGHSLVARSNRLAPKYYRYLPYREPA